jgi:uncharacterized repeat protein (TIGR01451 family)
MRCGKNSILSFGILFLALMTVIGSMSVCQAQEEPSRPGILNNIQNRWNSSPMSSWMPGSDDDEEEAAEEFNSYRPELPRAQPMTSPTLQSRGGAVEPPSRFAPGATPGARPPVPTGRPSITAQSNGPYVPYRSGTPASGYQPPSSPSYGTRPAPYGTTPPRPTPRPSGIPSSAGVNPPSNGVSGRMSAFQERTPEAPPTYRSPYSRSGTASMGGSSGYGTQRSGAATVGGSPPSRSYGEASYGAPIETPRHVADARSVGEALSSPVVPNLSNNRTPPVASTEGRLPSIGSQYTPPTVHTRLGAGEVDATEAGVVVDVIGSGSPAVPEPSSAPQEIASNVAPPTPAPVAPEVVVPPTPIQEVPAEVATVPQESIAQAPIQTPVTIQTPTIAQQTEEPSEQVLVQHDVPVLSVETLGPSRILVGTESTYEVCVSNASSTSADQVVVSIGLPAWAEVAGSSATAGSASAGLVTGEVREYQWRIDRLNSRSREELSLRIIPREPRSIDLQVQLDYKKAAARTMIEVQEPRVEMALEGPSEVLWGQNYAYRLKVSNTGTGDATNLRLVLSPLGGDSTRNAEAMLPLLRAGEEKVMELSLTAVKDHQVAIEVSADADNGVHTELSRQISVLRADLDIEIGAPEFLFVGNEAEYSIQVRNTGTATADELTVTATLPSNVRYVSCVGNGRYDESSRQVLWSLESLPQGTERTLTLLCEMIGEGNAQVAATAAAATELSTDALASVQVQAMADLALSIEDPSGPVAVGDPAEYRLTIRNRGTKRAEDVRVVVSLDEGVSPIEISGARYGLGSGQIVFDSFPAIEAGGETVLTVRAESTTPGNHPFRVEVTAAMGVRLSSEESTYFYGSSAQEATPISPAPLGMPEMPTMTPLTPNPTPSMTSDAPAPMPLQTPTPAAGLGGGMTVPAETQPSAEFHVPLLEQSSRERIDPLPSTEVPQALSTVPTPETLTPVE